MSVPYIAQSFVHGCVSKEFHAFAAGKTSPITVWVRALGAAMHEECGGPGIGAVGMCFTGGFALAMATDERLMAPVLSQPSLPFALPLRRSSARSIDISADDLSAVKARCERGDLSVLGLRFSTDRLVPGQRFDFLRAELGDAFVAVELPGDAANPDVPAPAHSVLTEHLIDEPGQPTRDALDQVLDLFRARLVEPA
jgi:dienelactone hydrolase